MTHQTLSLEKYWKLFSATLTKETCMRTVLVPVVFIAIFVVDKLSFSSSSCPDKNARKFPVRFRLRRSWRGENLMELRNSVWNELCATVGRTTTKMNVHFVPRFFICSPSLNTHDTGLQGPLAGLHACSTSRFFLSGFLMHGWAIVVVNCGGDFNT